ELWILSQTEKAAIRTADIQNVVALEGAQLITRENAVEELLKRESITVKPDMEELERQRAEMMDMANMSGIGPEEGTESVRGAVRPPPAPSLGVQRAFNSGEWDESKHPRADDGKFGAGGGGGKAEDEGSEGEVADVSEWGEAFPEFTGKPAEAIEHLMKEKRGYVPGAFHRDDLGPIDLPWGKEGKNGFGVTHIIERRNEQGHDGEAFVRDLPELVSDGICFERKGFPNKKFIAHEGKEAIIRLDWDRKKKTWIASAFYRFDQMSSNAALALDGG
ncbi:MAG: hypothetical protein FWG74_09270, partial [Planctomycetes bacterium]|nr:hypothetical protein [Planctomycetota bacterium]